MIFGPRLLLHVIKKEERNRPRQILKEATFYRSKNLSSLKITALGERKFVDSIENLYPINIFASRKNLKTNYIKQHDFETIQQRLYKKISK